MIAAAIASVAARMGLPQLVARFDAGHIHLYGMRKTRLRASFR